MAWELIKTIFGTKDAKLPKIVDKAYKKSEQAYIDQLKEEGMTEEEARKEVDKIYKKKQDK